MAEQNFNPFEDEKPKLVHLEKNDSHYEYCRMQMHDIDKIHCRTFICNLALCILVCFFSIFKKYVAMFDLLSHNMLALDRPEAILTGGIFTILIGMLIIVLGYLAWANYHTLNIILCAWYTMVTLIGVFRLDYLSALIGVVGTVFYFFSIRELSKEQALSQMEGYPDFHEKFDISKSDIVIQTLMAHQGERRTKSTLFTTDYSLRRKKKKNSAGFGYTEPEKTGDAGAALAEELKKHLDEVRETKQKETDTAAAASPEAVAEMPATETGMADLITDTVPEAVQETPAEPAAETEPAAEPEPEKMAEPHTEKAAQQENIETARADAEAAAAAILAEAEERSKKMLEEAEKKAKALTEAASRQTQTTNQPNPNRKKKKRR